MTYGLPEYALMLALVDHVEHWQDGLVLVLANHRDHHDAQACLIFLFCQKFGDHDQILVLAYNREYHDPSASLSMLSCLDLLIMCSMCRMAWSW